MDAKAQNNREGEGAALAFCVAGAFSLVVLAPATLLLDLKATAGALLVVLLAGGLAARLLRRWPIHPVEDAPSLMVLGLAVPVWGFALAASPYRRLVPVDPALFTAVMAAFLLAYGPWQWLERLLGAWRWSILAVSGYALLQRMGVEPLPAYADAGSQTRAMATFGNASYLAAFLCLSWPLLLAWSGGRRAAAIAFAWAALLATQSRAGALALAVQLGLWGIQAWRKGWRPNRDLAAMAVFMAVAVAWLFPPTGWLRPTLRWTLWRGSAGLWAQHPWFGWGPGSFAMAFQDHGAALPVSLVNAGAEYASDPHQLLLAVGCSAGWIGLAALGWGVGSYFWAAGRSPLREAGPLGLGLAGLLVESQFDRFFFQPGVFIPLCIGFAVVARGSREPSLIRPRAALALIPLGLWVAWFAVRPLLAYHASVGSDMGASAQAQAPAQSVDELEKAAQSGTDPAASDRLGAALAAAQRYSEAATAYGSALRLAPSSGRAQNLGNCLMMLGDFGGAEAAFRKSVALDPRSADAHFSLGYALFDEKKLTQALAEVDEALKLDPDHANALTLKRQITQ
jgi:tetratricopeptide (TPR) repeat protein